MRIARNGNPFTRGGRTVVLTVLLIFLIAVMPVLGAPLPNNRHIFVNVANDAGVLFNWDGPFYGGPNNTYYIKADGGGLNELHITSDPAIVYGQVSTTDLQSGTLYVSNTGGRGWDNDIILLLAVNGTIPDNFAVRIKSSGYRWTPAPQGNTTPAPPTDYSYVNGAVDETFTRADLVYGPQIWKPGPGILGDTSLPVVPGQDMSDTDNTFQLVFIDLAVGNLESAKFPGVSLVDQGAAKVEYSFTGFPGFANFNGYGWCSAANQGQGISWTNQPTGVTASGYSVISGQGPVAPTADFRGTPTSGNAPLTVRFTDISSGSPTSWKWDFNNDGVIDSTAKDPVHTYTTAGTYSVNLTVTNARGSTSKIKSGYINAGTPPAPPAANFTGTPTSGNAPLTVLFTDFSTGAPTSYYWDLNNDGLVDNTSKNPGWTYAAPGTYTVNLTVANAGGRNTSLRSGYISVAAPPVRPTANFTASPTSGNAPLTIQFTDSSTGSPSSWKWDFNNDGSIDSTVQNPKFTIGAPGTYSVKLTVTNAAGSNSKLRSGYITVTTAPASPPVARFSASPKSGLAPLTVQFADASTGSPTAWAWDFNNDGVIDSTVKNPSRTFKNAGNYSVMLTVTNAGGSNSRLRTDFIAATASTPPPTTPPVARFSASPRLGPAPLTVQFTDTSTGSPTSWAWDFDNDGSIDSVAKNPGYTFSNAGNYSVKLTVANAGGSNSRLKSNFVAVTAPTPPPTSPPVARFSASPRSGPAPLTVQFTDTSAGSPTSWKWDFNNDGVIDKTNKNPRFTYQNPGNYSVMLTVTNAGGSNSRLKPNFVVVGTAGV